MATIKLEFDEPVAKVIVFGGQGFLGQAIARCGSEKGFVVDSVSRAECDVTKPVDVMDLVMSGRPDVVINCAAIVRPRLCEEDPIQAWQVNALGALNCAQAAEAVGATLVQISANVVFDGTSAPFGEPRFEWANPDARSLLGQTKIAAEGFVRSLCSRWVIARTGMLFGPRTSGNATDLVSQILNMSANKQTMQMTENTLTSISHVDDVAQAILGMVRRKQVGLFHLVNEGAVSPFALAEILSAFTGHEDAQIEPTTATVSQSFVLGSGLTLASGVQMRSSLDALAAIVRPMPADG